VEITRIFWQHCVGILQRVNVDISHEMSRNGPYYSNLTSECRNETPSLSQPGPRGIRGFGLFIMLYFGSRPCAVCRFFGGLLRPFCCFWGLPRPFCCSLSTSSPTPAIPEKRRKQNTVHNITSAKPQLTWCCSCQRRTQALKTMATTMHCNAWPARARRKHPKTDIN
jgi:hypothetical protein